MCSEALISVATIAGFSGEVRLPPSGEAHTQCRWDAVSYQVGPKADLHLRKQILKLKNWSILWCQRKPPVIWSPKMNVLTSELIWSVTDQSWPGWGRGTGPRLHQCSKTRPHLWTIQEFYEPRPQLCMMTDWEVFFGWSWSADENVPTLFLN